MKGKKRILGISLLFGLGVVAATSGKWGEGRYKLVGLFSQVVAMVRSNYVDEVPLAKLEEGALAGLVAAADPQGTWVPSQLWDDFQAYSRHPLPPFGLVLGMQSTYPVVLEVIPDSAAARAGILPGELIERVGDQPVRARPFWRVVIALEHAFKRGEALQLDVIARDLSEKRTVRLEGRQEGNPGPKVENHGDVTLVRIPVLGVFQAAQLGSLLPTSGPVVIDLRGTVLGEPQGVVDVAALLLGGDAQLALKARSGEVVAVKASRPQAKRKVVVCVDHTTARAGEWLAYTLSQRGAPLVGVDTFGDAGWREAVPVADGKLWVVQKVLYNADREPLLGKGLKPTVQVRPQEGRDPILEKALELARGEESSQAA